MQFVVVIFLAFAFTCSTCNKIEEAENFLDEVFRDYLPSAIEAAGLKVYKLPDFTYDHKEKKSDGQVLETKIFYREGNLTGLQGVVRKSCLEPSETSENVNVVCEIAVPHLRALYDGRFQSIRGFQNPFGVHIRQFDFDLYIDISDVELQIEVTSSRSTNVPSLKELTLKYEGRRALIVDTEAKDPEDVTEIVEEKFNDTFSQLFLGGGFQKALGSAIGRSRYP